VKRSRINKISTKHRKALAEYKNVRKEYLLASPYCENCGIEATDIHHKARRGPNLCKKETFMSVCRTCHQKIHDCPAWAKENKYLI
jgi:hypothetical protein